MQVTITIVADSMAEAMAALGSPSPEAPSSAAPAKGKADKAPPSKNTVSTDSGSKAKEETKEKDLPTLDKDVVPLITRVAGMPGGGESLKSLMSEFGVERAGQLEAARYPELIGRLQDILG